MGQRGHGLNASGYGSWPYILAIEFNDDNIVSYGGDSINVVYGNTDDSTSIELANRNPADRAEIHLTISDPALNIDPTGTDVWEFDLSASAATPTVKHASNGTGNTALTATLLGQMGCVSNCQLTSDGEAVLGTGANTVDLVTMTETGANTGVFESFDSNGAGQFETIAEAAADTKIVFSYGGNSVDMIITYNDATITFDAGGDWAPGTAATVSVNDPDQNRNPTSAETLSVGDETAVIPTIKMGTGGLTLAEGTNLKNESATLTASCTTFVCTGVVVGDDDSGAAAYTLTVANTTDNSERLRIILGGETGTGSAGMVTATETWINVTTGHTVQDVLRLPGTVVLSYDISAPADLVSSTGIKVYVTTDGNNSTDNLAGSIDVLTSGNVKSGVYDLTDYGGGSQRSEDVGLDTLIGSQAQTAFISVAFEITHAAGNDMASNALCNICRLL
jgi:hypothetical protein